MKYQNEIRKLEKRLATLRTKAAESAAKNKKTALQKVTSLVKKLGYASIHHLLQNVDNAIASGPARLRGKKRITDVTRKSVVAMLKDGETVTQTARMHRISAPSVNNIKKAAGLTKSKKNPKAKQSTTRAFKVIQRNNRLAKPKPKKTTKTKARIMMMPRQPQVELGETAHMHKAAEPAVT